MENLNKKYELLYSQLEPIKREKLRNIVDEWLPIFTSDFNKAVELSPQFEIIQEPRLLPSEYGVAVSKLRFYSYVKHMPTKEIFMINLTLTVFRSRQEEEQRIKHLVKHLETLSSKALKEVAKKADIANRFKQMITSYDKGYGLQKHMDTLAEVNKLLRPYLKELFRSNKSPTIQDYLYKANHLEIYHIIKNLTTD
ncbi:hypothetical protein [Vibrio natriegens]|uniref:hypothetical protein n=1 Tax=Vibrio natriegens TaxID=691 RepID=UPI0039090B09